MRLIEPSVYEVIQESGIEGIYKQIATAGRICYASDKTTDNKEFVDRLLSMNHGRPLEFGTVYLIIPYEYEDAASISFLKHNNWTRVIFKDAVYYVTTNYRVLVENNKLDLLSFLSECTEYHVKRRTFHWTIARGIADEYRTHCAISSLMQSTRYCKYSLDRFNNELTFVKPHWISSCNYNECSENERIFFKNLEQVEYDYMKLCEKGYTAEQARDVLPLCLKTEFIQCGFEDDWNHFLDLRLRGTTGKPHPDSIIVAKQLEKLL